MHGQKIIFDAWATSRRSTSPAAQPGTSGTSTKTPSSWYPLMMIGKLDRCEREKCQTHHAKLSQVFDENKEDRTPMFRRTRGHAKDHSTKHCEQTWNGTAHIITTMVATRASRLSIVRTPRHSVARSQLVERVIATEPYRNFSQVFRIQTSANVVHASGGEDRTPCRTNIFSQCRAL